MTYTLWYFCNLLCTTIRGSWTKQIDLLWGFVLSAAAARHLGTSRRSPAAVCPQPELSSRRRSPPIIDLTPPPLTPSLNSCFAPLCSPAARWLFPLARAPPQPLAASPSQVPQPPYADILPPAQVPLPPDAGLPPAQAPPSPDATAELVFFLGILSRSYMTPVCVRSSLLRWSEASERGARAGPLRARLGFGNLLVGSLNRIFFCGHFSPFSLFSSSFFLFFLFALLFLFLLFTFSFIWSFFVLVVILCFPENVINSEILFVTSNFFTDFKFSSHLRNLFRI